MDATDRLIVRKLREAADTDDRMTYSAALREVAAQLVDLRRQYTDSQDRPDLRGDSRAYRNHLADLYSRASLDKLQRRRLGGTIRWHISAVLRDTESEETLAEYGLERKSALERRTDLTRQREATYRTMMGEAPPPEPARAVRFATISLQGVESKHVRSASSEERDAISAELDNISRELSRLRRALR